VPDRARRARWAVTAFFALNGFLFASVYSRFPAVQDRTGASEGELGLALLCAMLGLLVTQPLAGALVSRFGSRPIMYAGALIYSIGLVPVALAQALVPLAVAMVAIGIGSGLLDVAMNVHGLTVEGRLGRPILSGLHAAFSFGALGGAALGGLLAGAGVGVVVHLAAVAVAGSALVIGAGPLLLPPGADAVRQGPMFAVPTRGLVLVGLFALCVLLSEGAVGDWAAVYLNDEVGTGEGTAATGLAAFSLTMAIGRLAGDRLNRRFGAVSLARAGGSLAALGIATALLADGAVPAIAGFAVAGLGLSSLFPLALRAAAARGATAGTAVAAVSAMGYVGFLAGPPAIGGLAELFSLRGALLLPVACCALAAALGRRVRAPSVAISR
jgi:MFS family permease